MPRYKYSCSTCGLDDVKQIDYKLQKPENLPAGLVRIPTCPTCGKKLKKEFMKPPKNWFNEQRNRS